MAARPAKGAGHGGPAKGEGWGGSAKGAGNGSEAAPIEAALAVRHDSSTLAAAAERAARNERWAEEMRQLLYEKATRGESEQTQIVAADKLLDRIEGKPVARQVTADVADSGLVINVLTKFRPDP